MKTTVAELTDDERATWEEITAETVTDADVAKVDKLVSSFMYTTTVLQALAAWYEREGGDCAEARMIRELAAKLAIVEAQTV